MSVFKDFRFNVVADWIEGTRGLVHAGEKPVLDVSTPRELRGEHPDLWSPEELLLAACASCYELTVVAVAEHRQVPLHSLEVRAAGHVTRRSVGRLGFVAIELDVELVTDPDLVAEAEDVAKRAQAVCIVTQALDVPLHVRVLARAKAVVEEGVLVP
jgi:organic hydroperoxide reductase OsmC/OhrA